MTECKKIRKQLSAYLDGETFANSTDLIERHLGECEGCRKELNDLKLLVESLKTWETPSVPRDLTARFWMRVRQKPLPKQQLSMVTIRRFLRGWAALLCTLAVGFLFGAYLGSVIAKPDSVEIAMSTTESENMSEITYLSDVPSESLAEAYITVIADESGQINGLM